MLASGSFAISSSQLAPGNGTESFVVDEKLQSIQILEKGNKQ